MINCTEAVRQLWDYIEKGLHGAEQERMEEHLAFCQRCCGEVEFAQELRSVMQEAARPYVPEQVAERLEKYLEDLETSTS